MRTFSNLFNKDPQFFTGKVAWRKFKNGEFKSIAFDACMNKEDEEPIPHVWRQNSAWDWKIIGYLWAHLSNKKWYEVTGYEK